MSGKLADLVLDETVELEKLAATDVLWKTDSQRKTDLGKDVGVLGGGSALVRVDSVSQLGSQRYEWCE